MSDTQKTEALWRSMHVGLLPMTHPALAMLEHARNLERENAKLCAAAKLALDALSEEKAAWMRDAAREAQAVEFYRGLLDECAKHLGPEAYTADDGGVHDSPVRLKIPELVARLVESNVKLCGEITALREKDALIQQLTHNVAQRKS